MVSVVQRTSKAPVKSRAPSSLLQVPSAFWPSERHVALIRLETYLFFRWPKMTCTHWLKCRSMSVDFLQLSCLAMESLAIEFQFHWSSVRGIGGQVSTLCNWATEQPWKYDLRFCACHGRIRRTRSRRRLSRARVSEFLTTPVVSGKNMSRRLLWAIF